MAGQHQSSTVTVMERVPLLLLSKSAVTYLVDTLTSLGLVSTISFPELVSSSLFHYYW